MFYKVFWVKKSENVWKSLKQSEFYFGANLFRFFRLFQTCSWRSVLGSPWGSLGLPVALLQLQWVPWGLHLVGLVGVSRPDSATLPQPPSPIIPTGQLWTKGKHSIRYVSKLYSEAQELGKKLKKGDNKLVNLSRMCIVWTRMRRSSQSSLRRLRQWLAIWM